MNTFVKEKFDLVFSDPMFSSPLLVDYCETANYWVEISRGLAGRPYGVSFIIKDTLTASEHSVVGFPSLRSAYDYIDEVAGYLEVS